MRTGLHEVLAGAAVLAAVVVPPLALHRGPAADRGPARVVSLTGVKKDGAWTDEVVDGTNYWRKTFRSATPVLRRGEEVVLRLASADVRHGFYAPELGLGPVSIDPGKVVELRFRPETAGEYTYYCTEVCGACHFGMRGVIKVVEPGTQAETTAAASCDHAQPDASAAPPPVGVARGARIFRQRGCFHCHGEGGSGGVHNHNYLAGNVPQNNLIAEKMGLFEPEDAQKAIDLLVGRTDLDAVAEPPFRNWPRFVAQTKAIHALILNGNPAGRKDPAGPQPPLSMPSWRYLLSDGEVDDTIAYLISQYPWKDD